MVRSKPKLHRMVGQIRAYRKPVLLWSAGGIAGIVLLVQLLYPSHLLLPFTTVDGQSVALKDRDETIRQFNNQYKNRKLPVYFGSAKDPYRTPTPNDIGLTIDVAEQIRALDYPWWLRIVPTSIVWAHATRTVSSPHYHRNDKQLQQYMTKELGESCDVVPKNANLTVKDNTIRVIPSQKGGTCTLADVKQRLAKLSPRLHTTADIRIPMKEREPAVSDDQATVLKKQLEERLAKMVMTAGSEKVAVPGDLAVTWLDFTPTEQAIVASVNPDRSKQFFSSQLAPKVTKTAGISKVSTMDFTETSRVNGAPGQAIDTVKTLESIGHYLRQGGEQPSVAVMAVPPRVEYTRSYSPTDVGLSALVQQYAESHPGTYGVSLIELSGQRRRAVFQDTKQFRTASTYKLYVAYGTLKRVEAGTWRWSDQVQGGRTLEKCFDDMIVKSDNPCGEVLLAKIGYTTLTNELKSVGLTATSFTGAEPVTTAGDLSVFNAALESGQLVSADSKSRLIGAMKRNIYRQGVPAGANGTVANKVGFLNGFLHDAAIIYGPNGPVILSIMTDGSSWAAIADLTKQIEALRAR